MKKINSKTLQEMRTLAINALATKIAYTTRLRGIRYSRNIGDWIILSIPILIYACYSLPRSLGLTEYKCFVAMMDALGLISGFCIVIYGIYRGIFQPDTKLESYIQGLTLNINQYHEAKFVISNNSEEIAQWYLKMSSVLENQDTSILADIGPIEKQSAYRQALIEFAEGNCPYCNCNPVKYVESKECCQICGNTSKEGFNI